MKYDQSEYNKPEWWDANLKWVLSQKPLFAKGKLQYKYMEMLGQSGHEMYGRMSRHLKTPKDFIGVDTSLACIMHSALRKDPFRVVFRDIYAAAASEERLGVLNLDTESAASDNWWDSNWRKLRGVVAQASSKCPSFVLILNHTLDQPYTVRNADVLHRHAENVYKTFRECDGKKWRIPSVDAMVRGVGDKVTLDKVGAFHIYRSEGRVLRMVTIRMVFNGKHRSVSIEGVRG